MKYIKKPIEVEARQFTDENKDQVYGWARSLQGNVYHSWDGEPFKSNPIIVIPTLEGDMKCELGDYIIVEPFPTDWRKLYPCKADIFEQTYAIPKPFQPVKSLQEHDIQEPEQILRDVLYKHGFVYSDFQWRYVVAHRHIEIEAMKLYASQFKTPPVQEDIGCKCTKEEEHGWTTIKCCNHCGKPTEDFWTKRG